MPVRRSRPTLLLMLALSTAGNAASAPLPRHAAPAHVNVRDSTAYADVNRMRMAVTNFGTLAFGPSTSSGGLEYPRGSGAYVVFAAGLWLGAKTPGGELRIAASLYASEFGPGTIQPGGAADDPTRPEYHVFPLGGHVSPTTRDEAFLDYVTHAVPQGAPAVSLRDDGSPSIVSDQMLWSVFNDANPALHQQPFGRTAPLHVEVRQAVLGWDRTGPAGDAVLVDWRLHNAGGEDLDSLVVGFWVDADIGYASDDLMGSEPDSCLGYMYGGTDNDMIYHARSPAIGVTLLRGPELSPGGPRVGVGAIITHGHLDSDSSIVTWRMLRGLDRDGSPIVDPTTQQPTTFMDTGDPVTGTGWLDTLRYDKRVLVATTPFTLAAGDSAEYLFALVAGQGNDHLASITAMRENVAAVRAEFAGLTSFVGDHLGPFPPDPPEAPPPGPELRVAPNPASTTASIAIGLDPGKPARVELYDVNGRFVRSQGVEAAAPGPTVARFDLRGLRPGLYFVRAKQGVRTRAARFVLVP